MSLKVLSRLLCVLLLLPPVASAALRYEISIEVIREDEVEHFAERVTADGDNARVDFLNADGQPDGSYMLSNDGGKTMIIHDGQSAICAEWDRAEFFAAAGRMLDKGQRMVNAEMSAVETVKESEQEGPEMEGYPTTHITLRTNYQGLGKLLFIKFRYDIEEIDDMWMTDALEVPEFERGWIEAATRTGHEFIDEHESNWLSHVHGAVLKHTNVIRITNARSGKVQEKTEHFTVSAIEILQASDLPPALFEAPTCEKVEKSEMQHQAERMLKKYMR